MRISPKTLLKLFLIMILICVTYLYLSFYYIQSEPIFYDLQAFQGANPIPPHLRKKGDDLGVYPNPGNPMNDRILAQIRFVPESVRKLTNPDHLKKKVLLYYTESQHPIGSSYFETHACAVKACNLITDVTKIDEADVVVFSLEVKFLAQDLTKRPGQIWVLYLLESPENAPLSAESASSFNWTATYRHDSTLVAPYEKYVPVHASVLEQPPTRNYATGKRRLVAWFVSNCQTANQRERYVKELARYIPVDVYGACGPLECPKGTKMCSIMLNVDYKFYLAFENSNCRDYITEKFFITGLQHDIIPVVMGAPVEDYRRVAPPHSFIHVDNFKSPADLASYLHLLDRDDALYNSFFRWKGLWKHIDTLFPCRLCSLAHDVDRRGNSWYKDVNRWWSGPGICINGGSWKTGHSGG